MMTPISYNKFNTILWNKELFLYNTSGNSHDNRNETTVFCCVNIYHNHWMNLLTFQEINSIFQQIKSTLIFQLK